MTPGSSELQRALIDTDAIGDTALVAAQTGKRIRVYRLLLRAAGAVSVGFLSGSTVLCPALPGVVELQLPFDGESWFETAKGEALNLNLGAGIAVAGLLYYTLE